jgi:hypothetical protein
MICTNVDIMRGCAMFLHTLTRSKYDEVQNWRVENDHRWLYRTKWQWDTQQAIMISVHYEPTHALRLPFVIHGKVAHQLTHLSSRPNRVLWSADILGGSLNFFSIQGKEMAA